MGPALLITFLPARHLRASLWSWALWDLAIPFRDPLSLSQQQVVGSASILDASLDPPGGDFLKHIHPTPEQLRVWASVFLEVRVNSDIP